MIQFFKLTIELSKSSQMMKIAMTISLMLVSTYPFVLYILILLLIGARRLADWYPLHANDYWHVQYDAMDWEQNKDTCCKDCLKDYWRLFWAYTKYLPAIEWRWVQHPSKDKKVLRPVAV